jgi:glucokinase
VGHTIGVDVGGTKIAGGLVDEAGVILARTRRDTPSTDPAAIVHDIVAVVDALRSGGDVEAVGIGSAGIRRRRAVDDPVLAEPRLAGRAGP